MSGAYIQPIGARSPSGTGPGQERSPRRGPMTTRAEDAAEQARLRFVAVLAGAMSSGMQLGAWFGLVDGGLGAVGGNREAFTAEEAERWLERQARTLKPKKPRDTAAKRRRALMAELAAAGQGGGRSQCAAPG